MRTDERLKPAAKAVAATIPGAEHRELAGQTHNAAASAIAPELEEFFVRPGAPAQVGAHPAC